MSPGQVDSVSFLVESLTSLANTILSPFLLQDSPITIWCFTVSLEVFPSVVRWKFSGENWARHLSGHWRQPVQVTCMLSLGVLLSWVIPVDFWEIFFCQVFTWSLNRPTSQSSSSVLLSFPLSLTAPVPIPTNCQFSHKMSSISPSLGDPGLPPP